MSRRVFFITCESDHVTVVIEIGVDSNVNYCLVVVLITTAGVHVCSELCTDSLHLIKYFWYGSAALCWTVFSHPVYGNNWQVLRKHLLMKTRWIGKRQVLTQTLPPHATSMMCQLLMGLSALVL